MAHNPPTLSITPTSTTIEEDGGSVNFTVTVTNNDTSDESTVTFNLVVTDSNTNDFLASSITPPSLTLAPGETKSAVLTVTDREGSASDPTNNVTVSVSSPVHDTVSETVTVTLVGAAATGWAKEEPTVEVSPGARTIHTDGGLVEYEVKVINKDSGVEAQPVVFTLSVQDENTADFEPSTIEPTEFTLGPGESGRATLRVRDRIGGPLRATNVTRVLVTADDHPTAVSQPVTTQVALDPMNVPGLPSTVWLVRRNSDGRLLGVFSSPELASQWVQDHGLAGEVTVEKTYTDLPTFFDAVTVVLVKDVGTAHRLILLECDAELETHWRTSLHWADYVLTMYGCDRIAPLEENDDYSELGLPPKIVIPLPNPRTGELPTASETTSASTKSKQIGVVSLDGLDKIYVVLLGRKLV